MVKALTFKGDKKPAKKRKRAQNEPGDEDAPLSKQLVPAADAEPEDDDNWVSAEALSDISGPVMFVLPSKPVTCLATDAMGKVHASPVENMVEDEPRTAEPHLVSQVWIATRVVGSEKEFTFKGHHGRYLGCDRYGICSATREAISPEETFKLQASSESDVLFCLQTSHSTFVSISEGEVRGDAEEESEHSRLRIRMQARFKPRHKVEKAEKVRAKISRKELEEEVGRRLEDDEVKMLKKARREGNYHEAMLDVKVKGKHDKFA